MDYIIQPGDTLGAVARKFGITLDQLLAANPQITNPNAIFPGQRITIPTGVPSPTPGVYIVRPGDTLSLIAGRFGLTLAQLLAANPQITNPNVISVGQRINIPTVTPPPATTTYTIQPGDTLYLIAKRLGTSVDTLLRLNPGINPSALMPGQVIRVPAPSAVTPPGCIVYVSTRTGRPELWRSDAAGRGAVQITSQSGTAAQPVANPKWSPNGQFIAYQAVGGLFIIDPCGRRPFLVAPDVSYYSCSHDSTRIGYSNASGTFVTDLRGASQLVNSELGNPVWFPGDQRLAGSVSETETIRFNHLAMVDVTGANFNIIDPAVPATTVLLSPNGRYAATETFKGYAYGVFSTLVIYDFNTKQIAYLPGFEIPIRDTEFRVVHDVSHMGGWSPDSARFVYSTVMTVQGQGEIRIANPQGTILQRFTRSYYPITGWGPVSDWIIYTVSEQPGTSAFDQPVPRDIYVRNLTTNQEIQIAGPADEYSPDWSGVSCIPC